VYYISVVVLLWLELGYKRDDVVVNEGNMIEIKDVGVI
jgi:hypothetical protein